MPRGEAGHQMVFSWLPAKATHAHLEVAKGSGNTLCHLFNICREQYNYGSSRMTPIVFMISTFKVEIYFICITCVVLWVCFEDFNEASWPQEAVLTPWLQPRWNIRRSFYLMDWYERSLLSIYFSYAVSIKSRIGLMSVYQFPGTLCQNTKASQQPLVHWRTEKKWCAMKLSARITE